MTDVLSVDASPATALIADESVTVAAEVASEQPKKRRTSKSRKHLPYPDMPFVVGDSLHVGDCWRPGHAEDRSQDLDRGRRLALAYIESAAQNPYQLPGGLMQIVSSMAARGALDQKVAGDSDDTIAVGFLSEIDLILRKVAAIAN